MPRQFSLKTLLWLMACVACYLAGVVSHRAYVEHQRAEALKKYHESFHGSDPTRF
ncbi:MAG TPA: hypothetical protein VHC22_12325 [Pirellulales bacterium]|nr:hypothetical protein [Pirellulales bacterium]